MNEQSMDKQPLTTTTVHSTKWPQLTTGLFFAVVLPIVCLVIAFLTPSPYKLWGLAGVLSSVGPLILFRAIAQFLDSNRAKASLPYSISTFLVLVPLSIWATGDVQHVALIVYVTIVGVTLFYSLVWVTVDEFKKNVLHR